MAKLAAICAALLSCLAFTPAAASAAPSQQEPGFTVRLLTANGTGCPPDSTTVSQVDPTVFTVTYSAYTAFAGGGVSPTQRRLNCQINVQVGVPSGWTFGILEADYRGYAYLDNGARGTLTADYWFEGQSVTHPRQHLIYGPKDYNYTFSDQAGVMAWAPCNFKAALEINTSVRVLPGYDSAFANELTLDSSVIGLGTLYHLGFRQC